MTSPSNTARAREVERRLWQWAEANNPGAFHTELTKALLAVERRVKEECARIAEGDEAAHADCGHEDEYWDGRTDAAIAIRATIPTNQQDGVTRG